MPWEITTEADGCAGYAVVKIGDGKVVGCHTTRQQAEAQLLALNLAEPEAALKALADRDLLTAHDRLHAIVVKQAAWGAEEVEAHHLIAAELRARNIDHPEDSGALHDAVITMSKVRVPVRSLAKMLSPSEVEAIARMAAQNGTKFAEVVELLTANGWVLRAEPAEPEDEEDDAEDDTEVEDEYAALIPAQVALAEAYDKVVETHGKFSPEAAHYVTDNPFNASGMNCANCVAFRGGGMCEWVAGQVAADAVCKLWVIPNALLKVRDHQPRNRAGEFIDAATAGVGVVASAQAAPAEKKLCGCDGDIDKTADGACKSCGGFVLPARKAADTFTPPAGVQEEAARALTWIEEGHAGDGFTAVGRRRASQLANGEPVSEDTIRRMTSYFARHEVDKKGGGWSPGEDGYPSPGRVAWAAWGGDPGQTWAERITRSLEKAATFVKASPERRFTLGPWYVPDSVDAHGEWTDANELQAALWDYVKKGNREIRLQHTPGTKAGEWVEALTWPFPVQVPMLSPETGQTVVKTFPAGTVFLGVQWEPWAWEMVKKGEIRGYSIGGSAERVGEEPMLYAKHFAGQHNQAAHGGGGSGGGGAVPQAASERVGRAEGVVSRNGGKTLYDDADSLSAERAQMASASQATAIDQAKTRQRSFQSTSEGAQQRSEMADRMRGSGNTSAADTYEADSVQWERQAQVDFNMAAAWSAVARDLGATDADLTV